MAKPGREKTLGAELSSAFHEKASQELERLREMVADNLKEEMISLLESEVHADILVTNGKTSVRAHKCIIQARCRHLWQDSWVAQLADTDGVEEMGCLEMSDLSGETLVKFLRQLYSVNDSALLLEEYVKHMPGSAHTITHLKSEDSGTVSSDPPRPDTVSSDPPRPDTVSSDPLRPDTVSSDPLRPDTVSSDPPRPDTVSSDPLRPDTVSSDPPRPDTVSSDPLRPDTVSSDPLRPDTVSSDPLRPDTVSSDPLRPDTVSSDPLRPDTVSSDPPRPDTVSSDPLRPDTVSSDPPRPDTVSSDPLRPDTVSSDPPRPDTVSSSSCHLSANIHVTQGKEVTSEGENKVTEEKSKNNESHTIHEAATESQTTHEAASESLRAHDALTESQTTYEAITESQRVHEDIIESQTAHETNKLIQAEVKLQTADSVEKLSEQAVACGSQRSEDSGELTGRYDRQSSWTGQDGAHVDYDCVSSQSLTDVSVSESWNALMESCHAGQLRSELLSEGKSFESRVSEQLRPELASECVIYGEKKDKPEISSQKVLLNDSLCDGDGQITHVDPGTGLNISIPRTPVLRADSYRTCSTLGSDLLEMYLQEMCCDCCLSVEGVHFMAHKCVLSARSDYFLAMFGGQWSESKMATVNLEAVSQQAVRQLLLFLYGGVTELPACSVLREMFAIADMYGVLTFRTVLMFYVKRDLCHFFHRPCPACVGTICEAVTLCHYFCLEDLQTRCLKWMAKYFTKIWPTKSFSALPDSIHELCMETVLSQMTPANVLDITMECNKLISSLPRIKWTENVLFLVSQLMDSAIEFTSSHFIDVLKTKEFLQWAKVSSWKAGALEEIFFSVIDSLPVDTACLVFQTLLRLQTCHSNPDNPEPDMLGLLEAMISRCEKFFRTHIHQVTGSKQWSVLTQTAQARILENSAYVYLGRLPDLSSKVSSKQSLAVRGKLQHNRSYGRLRTPTKTATASATVQLVASTAALPNERLSKGRGRSESGARSHVSGVKKMGKSVTETAKRAHKATSMNTQTAPTENATKEGGDIFYRQKLSLVRDRSRRDRPASGIIPRISGGDTFLHSTNPGVQMTPNRNSFSLDISQEKVRSHEVSPEKFRTYEVSPEMVRTYEISPEKVRTHEITPQKVRTHEITKQKVRTHEITPQKVSPEKLRTHDINGEKVTHEAAGSPVPDTAQKSASSSYSRSNSSVKFSPDTESHLLNTAEVRPTRDTQSHLLNTAEVKTTRDCLLPAKHTSSKIPTPIRTHKSTVGHRSPSTTHDDDELQECSAHGVDVLLETASESTVQSVNVVTQSLESQFRNNKICLPAQKVTSVLPDSESAGQSSEDVISTEIMLSAGQSSEDVISTEIVLSAGQSSDDVISTEIVLSAGTSSDDVHSIEIVLSDGLSSDVLSTEHVLSAETGMSSDDVHSTEHVLSAGMITSGQYLSTVGQGQESLENLTDFSNMGLSLAADDVSTARSVSEFGDCISNNDTSFVEETLSKTVRLSCSGTTFSDHLRFPEPEVKIVHMSRKLNVGFIVPPD